MSLKETIVSVRELIAQNKIKEALDALKVEFQDDITVINFSARFTELKKEKNDGLISYEDYKVQKNKLNAAILNHLVSLENEDKETSKSPNLLSTILVFSVLIAFVLYFAFHKYTEQQESSLSEAEYTNVNRSGLKIFIPRFETYSNEDQTNCIGRSLEEFINVAKHKGELPSDIEVEYKDLVSSPKDLSAANDIVKSERSDLIIFGKAKTNACEEGDICFRFSLADGAFSQEDDILQVRKNRYDNQYEKLSPYLIETGNVSIDYLQLKNWLLALYEIKTQKSVSAYLLLDKIGADTSLTNIERSNRYNFIGKTYLELKSHEKAVLAYEKSIELNKDNLSSINGLGLSFRILNDNESALEMFERGLAKDPKDMNLLMGKAELLYGERKYAEVVELMDKLILHDKNHIFSYELRGKARIEMGNYSEAIIDLTKAVDFLPENASFQLNLGVAYMRDGKKELGVERYNEALRIDSLYANALVGRALYYLEIGEHRKSLLDLDKAIFMDSSINNALHFKGHCHYELAEFETAIDYCEKAIRYNQRILPSRIIIYNCLKELGDSQGLIKNLSILIGLDSLNSKYYYERGYFNFELGNKAIAKLDFEKAIDMGYKKPYAYHALSIISYESKEYKKAFDYMNKLEEFGKLDSSTHNLKGAIYDRLGDYEAALAEYEKSIALNPNNSEALSNKSSVVKKIKNMDEFNRQLMEMQSK